MRYSIFILLLSLPLFLSGQPLYDTWRSGNEIRNDTIISKVVINVESTRIKNTACGFYKVIRIDSLSNFYLIFVEKDNVKSTIYSQRCMINKGQKLKVNEEYYFELRCKDTLQNGTCLTPIQDITYFGKYKGYELGNLFITNDLCGIYISTPINNP